MRRVFLEGNRIVGYGPDVDASATSLASERPFLDCGYGSATEGAFLHLPRLKPRGEGHPPIADQWWKNLTPEATITMPYSSAAAVTS